MRIIKRNDGVISQQIVTVVVPKVCHKNKLDRGSIMFSFLPAMSAMLKSSFGTELAGATLASIPLFLF